MKRLLLTLLCLGLAPAAYGQNAIDLATGSWGIEESDVPEDADAEELESLRRCRSAPVHISVDPETMRYKAVHTGEDNFVATAPILAANSRYISLRYNDEERVMKNGDLQIWHMFFVTPDKFYWVLGPGVGQDERDGVISIARVRCHFAGV